MTNQVSLADKCICGHIRGQHKNDFGECSRCVWCTKFADANAPTLWARIKSLFGRKS